LKKTLKIRPKGEKTVGQVSADLLQKNPSGGVLYVDQAKEMLKDYMPNVIKCVNTHRKEFPGKDFYIKVLHKIERVFKSGGFTNVLHPYYIGTLACPTPNYDQDLFKFHLEKEELEFIWSIPCREVCLYYLENKEIIPPEEWFVLKTVLEFEDGTLFKKAKKLNGEKSDSGLLEGKA
jgi:hypothetical protein